MSTSVNMEKSCHILPMNFNSQIPWPGVIYILPHHSCLSSTVCGIWNGFQQHVTSLLLLLPNNRPTSAYWRLCRWGRNTISTMLIPAAYLHHHCLSFVATARFPWLHVFCHVREVILLLSDMLMVSYLLTLGVHKNKRNVGFRQASCKVRHTEQLCSEQQIHCKLSIDGQSKNSYVNRTAHTYPYTGSVLLKF